MSSFFENIMKIIWFSIWFQFWKWRNKYAWNKSTRSRIHQQNTQFMISADFRSSTSKNTRISIWNLWNYCAWNKLTQFRIDQQNTQFWKQLFSFRFLLISEVQRQKNKKKILRPRCKKDTGWSQSKLRSLVRETFGLIVK